MKDRDVISEVEKELYSHAIIPGSPGESYFKGHVGISTFEAGLKKAS